MEWELSIYHVPIKYLYFMWKLACKLRCLGIIRVTRKSLKEKIPSEKLEGLDTMLLDHLTHVHTFQPHLNPGWWQRDIHNLAFKWKRAESKSSYNSFYVLFIDLIIYLVWGGVVFFFFFFGCPVGMWNFLGHGSNPSHATNKAESLTIGHPRKFSWRFFKWCVCLFICYVPPCIFLKKCFYWRIIDA